MAAERKSAGDPDSTTRPRKTPARAAKPKPADPPPTAEKTAPAAKRAAAPRAASAKAPAAKAPATATRRRAASPKTGGKSTRRVPLVTEPGSELVLEHLSAEETIARALKARERLPLEVVGEWAPAADRSNPVSLLLEQEASRVEWLLPLRHGRMSVSPFTFYRGAAKVMAADLAALPNTGLIAQLCGDAHLANFGIYGTPERRLVFDVNDFDETLAGPWEWDVKRLVASMVIAARDRGFKKREQREVARSAARQYREAMAGFATAPALGVFYSSVSADDIMAAISAVSDPKMLKKSQKAVHKAQARTSLQVFGRLTEVVDGRRRIMTTPPTIYNFEDLPPNTTQLKSLDQVHGILRQYRNSLPADRRRLLERYRVVDVGLKVVGVGSVGTRCFIALLEGRDEGDPLFLQIKQAGPSVLEAHLHRSRYKNHGERVVAGQRLMQAASDIFLGWIPGVEGRDFYWRQLKDWKGSADIASMDPATMGFYGGLCGWTLARAHARSGDPLELASYMGGDSTFEEQMVNFAMVYADQNEHDYAEFMEAIDRGDLKTAEG